MKNYIPPKGEKQRRFKDPNAPKRPPSTFFIFCGDYRPKIKGENPGLSIGDIAKKLGEMWNSSSAEVKQPYEKKAAKLKEKELQACPKKMVGRMMMRMKMKKRRRRRKKMMRRRMSRLATDVA
uniref:High mobility group box 1b n=1 Tax=Sinocyclocheilus rhinocerous TaxID=307959 RepID=A0A673J183_9TELE